MLGWLRREAPGLAAVYFDGEAALADGPFAARLAAAGNGVEGLRPPDDASWHLRIDEAGGGRAELLSMRAAPPPLDPFVRFASNLTEAEKAACARAGSAVLLRVPATRKHLLADRKRLLRLSRLVLGDDGVVVLDVGSQLPWSRASLDDELAHDADLDVEALYALHAVHPGEGGAGSRVDWLHTHGLGELGGFDVDVLRPSQAFVAGSGEAFRSLAFRILDDDLQPSTPSFEFLSGRVAARLVPAEEFMRSAAGIDRSAREPGNDPHLDRRAVLCDPAAGGIRALFGGSDAPRPLRFAQGRLPEQLAVPFTSEATELMAERARTTVGLLPGLMAEFAEFEVVALAKIGYPTTDGRREHLWFQAHGFDADSVEATLESRPFGVPMLKPGDRGRHPLEQLTDWLLITPAGWVTPRSTSAARRLREGADEIRAAMRAGRGP